MTTKPSPDANATQLRMLRALEEAAARIEQLERGLAEPIAVIGLGCRFPASARDAASFWRLLRDGVDAIGGVPADRWDAEAYFDPRMETAGRICTRAGGFLDEVDRFDAEFFGIAPREAAAMDPQQRLLLEVAHEALDGAGQLGDRLAENPTGIFVGLTNGDYGHLLRKAAGGRPLDQYFVTGNSPNAAAGRVSYLLGLRGPSLAVDTACSSSSVAVHLACQSLRAGECRLALAGGVNLILAPEASIALSRARMLAPDGRCKTFSAAADGYGRGEGCGLVVLKRLADARRDGDRVLAVIRGSAVNQDGPTGGFTVPSGAAQRTLLQAALDQAKLAPADIDYVEAHGTGTALGDPIEINALADAFGAGRPAGSPLLVGSVKTNIGHLESAAGAAGLIKAVLALWHGEIPAHLHFDRPNPHIAWEDIPVKVAAVRQAWPANPRPRRAGVSSFGVSGTNAHIILEQASPEDATPALPEPKRRFRGLRHWFEPARVGADDWLYEVVWKRRPAAFAEASADSAAAADFPDPASHAAEVRRFIARAGTPPGGSAYGQVLDGLEALARLYARQARDRLGTGEPAPGRRRLWARVRELAAQAGAGEGNPAREAERLRAAFPGAEIECTLLERCGERLADVLRGACDPLTLLFPSGEKITAASLYREAPAAQRMNELVGAAVAALVAPAFFAEASAAQAGGLARRSLGEGPGPLRVLEIGAGTGATTGAVLPALPADAEYVFTDVSPLFVTQAGQRLSGRPGLRFQVLDVEQDPLRQGFGPGQFDLVIAANVLHATRDLRAALRHARSLLAPGGRLVLLEATRPLGFLDLIFGLTDGWWRFADADLRPDHALLSPARWAEALRSAGFAAPEAMAFPASAGAIFAAQAVITAQREDSPGAWLVLADRGGVASALAAALAGAGETCRLVHPEGADSEAYRRIVGEGPAWRGVVHLRGLDGGDAADESPVRSALLLAQALVSRPAPLWIVTRGAIAAAERDTVPGLSSSSLWGFARSLAQEHPELRAVRIDLDPAAAAADSAGELAAELLHPDGEDQIALRRGGRLVARLVRAQALPVAEASRLRPALAEAGRLRHDATYLVFGGRGGLGRPLARWLAARGARHLVLAGRGSPDAAAVELARELEAAGVDVRLERADVAIEADVARVLAGIAASSRPLRGVIHAAGVLDDGVVSQLTWERFARVLAPKVAGAWHLHRLTRDQPLDFFVLFSSATALFGSPGQANHAAANSFLDALAQHRRAAGLPAISIDWGAWAEIGAAAERQVAGRFRARGIGTIQPADGWRALGVLLAPLGARRPAEASAKAGAQIAVVPVDWPAVPLALTRSPFFDELRAVASPAAASAEAGGHLGQVVGQLPEPERRDRLAAEVRRQVAQILGLPGAESVDPQRGFFTLGMDSLTSVELRNRLQTALGRTLPATVVFDHPTAGTLAAYLSSLWGRAPMAEAVAPAPGGGVEPIAVIGLGLRFPSGADSPEALRQLLLGKIDAIGDVPEDRWSLEEFYDADPAARGKISTRGGGFIDGVDRFDAAFFGVSPREAVAMDPQQRLLLEVSWEALERAGIAPDSLGGSRTGIFVGISNHDYTERLLAAGPEEIDSYVGSGNAHSVAAGRLSYTLGLQGPSLAVDTACSSSLVAVHLACQSLRAGECGLALAAGVNLLLSPTISINHSRARMLAADGRCKSFDAAADGFVRSEGCGVVVLKRLSEARRDGDRILAVVSGSAVNQDGRTSGLTVPNGPAQQAVIRAALAQAGAEPGEVGLVEAHGTGTALGDPIEAGALAAVFGPGRDADRPLYLGSIKSNLGHAESAAGVAGLIKAVLAVAHGEIPAHLHFRNPNPLIPWSELPWLKVPVAAETWPAGRRRIAGVSSFGFGGTNAHVIIGEAPPEPAQPATAGAEALAKEPRVLILSAKTQPALRDLADRYAARLAAEPSISWADVCHTAAVGRAVFPHRLAILAANAGAAAAKLGAFVQGRSEPGLWSGIATDLAPAKDLRPPDVKSAADFTSGGLRSLTEAARTWTSGAPADWAELNGRGGRRVDLPTYPFQRRRYWCDEPARSAAALTYEIVWQPLGLAPAASACASADASARLAAATAARASGPGAWHLAGGSPELRRQLARELARRGRGTAETPDARTGGVAFLADELGGGSPATAAVAGAAVERLRTLARTLLAAKSPARIWIITRSGVTVAPEEGRDLALGAGPLWGFGKALSLEHPECFGGLLDLGAAAPGECARVVEAWLAPTGEDQLALRRGAFWVPRLRPRPIAPGGPAVRGDGAYLVTGGMGALGLKVAAWLAAQGARHLVLVGRSAPSPPAAAEVARLRAAGATVATPLLDVADAEALRKVIAGLPALRGVVHAAGLPGYAPVGELEAGALASVLRPKVGGAWALHEATRALELDFFVMFSSIASAWGSKGQAHYAAANQFLDGLAHHRRALGLPALSLNWGPWAAGGMATEEARGLLARTGVGALATDEALAALGGALAAGVTQLVVARVDWARFRPVFESRGPRPLLSQLERDAKPAEASAKAGAEWAALDGPELLARLRVRAQETVARVLRLPEGELPSPRLGFTEMGVDSLLAVEIRNRLAAELGLTLPATLVFDHPEIERLALFLAGQLGGKKSPPSPQERGFGGLTAANAARNRIALMTEEEAEAALLKKLGGS